MCSQQQVVNTAVCWDNLYMNMACPTCLCMLYRHMIFVALQMFHDPVWGLIINNNVYLVLSLLEVFPAVHKLTMLGTEFLYMIFKLYAWQVFNFLYMILMISPLPFSGTFSVLAVIQQAIYPC